MITQNRCSLKMIGSACVVTLSIRVKWRQQKPRLEIFVWAAEVSEYPRESHATRRRSAPNGDLAFHWKCMMAPPTIIDYVVVHELCHAHHRDHTSAFWNEVDKVLPHYLERKDWLRKQGAGMDL